MVNYKSIVKNLQKHYSDANEVVVVGNKGKVIYSTSIPQLREQQL